MRVRLFVLLLALMTIALAALGVPLAESQARARTQTVFLDRLNDTARFASIAQQTQENGESLPAATRWRGIPAQLAATP